MRGRVKHRDIVSSSISRFGVHERAVNTALIDSLLQHHHYVVRDIDYRQDRKKFDADAAFAITKLGMQSYTHGHLQDRGQEGSCIRA